MVLTIVLSFPFSLQSYLCLQHCPIAVISFKLYIIYLFLFWIYVYITANSNTSEMLVRRRHPFFLPISHGPERIITLTTAVWLSQKQIRTDIRVNEMVLIKAKGDHDTSKRFDCWEELWGCSRASCGMKCGCRLLRIEWQINLVWEDQVVVFAFPTVFFTTQLPDFFFFFEWTKILLVLSLRSDNYNHVMSSLTLQADHVKGR